MRKIALIVFISACCTLSSYRSVLAQEIVGAWLGTGKSSYGGKFVHTLHFFGNGGVQTRYVLSAIPNVPYSVAGIVNCQGTYQFNGQALKIRLSDCDGPSFIPMEMDAATEFQNPDIFTWANTTYRRQ
jgi:hypothetical protein